MEQMVTTIANLALRVKEYIATHKQSDQAKALQKVSLTASEAIGADDALMLETVDGDQVLIPAQSFTNAALYFQSLLSDAKGQTASIQEEADGIDFMLTKGFIPDELVESAQEALSDWKAAKDTYDPKARKS